MKAPTFALIFTVFLSHVVVGCSGDDDPSTDDLVDTGAVDDASLPDGDAGVPGPMIETSLGTIEGVDRADVRAFLGIPFAQPPLGELRWHSPLPAEPWEGVLRATEFGAWCPQSPESDLSEVEPTDEDCLTLNVWTPPDATEAPVMVFIHGGGFSGGSGAGEFYDGSSLARRGVVVVTLNYRLGVLGFLAHPLLGADDSDYPTSGNYGFLDQQLALRWVNEHIDAFGGDPGNVTLFGESAGAISVCTHLLLTRGGDLYHRAILESGVCAVPLGLEDAYATGELMSERVGCADAADELACLRAVPPADLVASLPERTGVVVGEGTSFRLIEDGVMVSGNPLIQMLTGDVEPVPTIIGTNRDEGRLFTWMMDTPVTDDNLHELVDEVLPGQADAILERYDAASYANAEQRMAAILGDGFFICAGRLESDLLAQAGQSVWYYEFAMDVSAPDFEGLTGSWHAAELPYVFDASLGGLSTDDLDRRLVDSIQTIWTDFARTGDPNVSESLSPVEQWPRYQTPAREYLILDSELSVGSGFGDDICEFWEDVYFSL